MFGTWWKALIVAVVAAVAAFGSAAAIVISQNAHLVNHALFVYGP